MGADQVRGGPVETVRSKARPAIGLLVATAAALFAADGWRNAAPADMSHGERTRDRVPAATAARPDSRAGGNDGVEECRSGPAHDAARPRGNPGRWITNDDYPVAALRAGQSGITNFTLDVGADGAATACHVTLSSGHAVLDTRACALLMRNARFAPARDAGGCPAPSTYSSRVRWEIPG